MLGTGTPFLKVTLLMFHNSPTSCHHLGIVITTCYCAARCLYKLLWVSVQRCTQPSKFTDGQLAYPCEALHSAAA